MRVEYRADGVHKLTKTKPAYITLEDLNITRMIRSLFEPVVPNQGFHDFTGKFLNACVNFGMELKKISQFYPSSKLCSFATQKI